MPHAISAWFDEEAESQIRRIWQNLSEAGISSSYHNGPFRPHITLSAYDDLRVQDLASSLSTYLESSPKIDLKFDSVGYFARPAGGAFFLTPTMTEALWNFRAKIAEVLRDYGSKLHAPYYEQDNWIPHCTLATRIPESQVVEAFAEIKKITLPVIAQITRVGIIKFPEEIELHELFLR